MGRYDKKIKEKSEFIDIIDSVIKKTFNTNLTVNTIKRIYLDLNSAISIMFRNQDIASPELTDRVKVIIEDFIRNALEKGVKITVLYTVTNSLVHTSIYPDWCKERFDRVDIKKSEFLKKLLMSLKVFSDSNKSIRVINTKEFHPVMIVDELDKPYKTGSLIISKDNVFRCLFKKGCSIFNGVSFVSYEHNMDVCPDGIELTEPYYTLPVYLTLKGDKRNDYAGMEKIGKIRAVDYCEVNRLAIKTGVKHEHKTFIDEHVGLFDIKVMKDVANHLGLDASTILEIKE